MPKPSYPGGVQSVGSQTERSPLEKIPEEDLALTLAQSTADPSCATSVLIAAPRRCGKSNIVRQAIAYANELHNANIDFNVWNGGKDDEDYCGLQNHDPDYLFTAHPENIEWATRLLLGDQGDEDSLALVRRCDRWVGYPTLLICDEWNNTLLAAQNADMLDKGNNYRDKLIVGSTQIVTRGPGKLVLGWFTSHSAFVKNVGWDEDIKKNISCVAIARIGRNEQGQLIKFGEAMKQALSGGSGKSSWVSDPDTRAALTARFDAWFNTNECAVVALTNLLGEWRLVRLPKYPDKQPPIPRGAMNQSITELST